MQSVEKFNELLEKINQKAQLENEIKESIINLTSSFSDNYYFHAVQNTENTTLGFCFYIPQKEESDHDVEKKTFTEVEIRNCFELIEEEDYSEGLQFTGFEVRVREYTAPLDIALSMMYGSELKNGMVPAYVSSLVERDYLNDKDIMQRQSNEKVSFTDFISQINKDHIKPYLKTLKINLDGKSYEQSKADKKEFIQEYNEIFDKLIHSLYSGKSLLNGVNDSEIKDVTDLMIHNNYTKMEAKLGSKENKTKAMKL